MQKLKEISQISIHIKDEVERVNEVALFHPLNRKTEFDTESKPISQRRWNYLKNIGMLRRLVLKAQQFLFKHAPFLIPMERQTKDAKFKTALAMLLSQETLRDFFLSNPKQREAFFNAVAKAAESIGYAFSIPEGKNPLQISRNLTWIEGRETSLLDDPMELNLQISTLNYFERNELLFKILNEIERPPIHSVLEITYDDITDQISLVTKYAKYKIEEVLKEGNFTYTHAENYATSSIKTLENTKPNAVGAMNQRVVFDAKESHLIGAYSGELTSPNHVLEQILLILNQKDGQGCMLADGINHFQEKRILFTSLYSWHEFGFLKDQSQAIHCLNRKTLKSADANYRLHLLHFNIPFNALNKYPSPQELSAAIHDLNDECLVFLTHEFFQKKRIDSKDLAAIIKRLEMIHTLPFFEKQELLLDELDHFKKIKKSLVALLQELAQDSEVRSLEALLSEKKSNGKPLKGIDKLIFLDIVAKYLGYFHSKNCQKSTDRSAGANAADKAQYAFQKCLGYPFLPSISNEDETALFKVFYSMYLVWEEPEITTALSTGFLGEKFYNNFFQKNPETTKYLIDWLKKHPEMYLGLSDYR